MDADRRRDSRYLYPLEVTLRVGRARMEVVAEDVSFRGLFVHTDSAPVVRQLLRVDARLPPDDRAFSSHAMCVYVAKPSDERGHGVGLQFYAMGNERREWERFVGWLKESGAEQSPNQVPELRVRRRALRYQVALAVRPRDITELLSLYTRDISTGGMFLHTDLDLAVGAAIRLELVHPVCDDSFALTAVVRRREEGEGGGLGVEFVDFDLQAQTALRDFVLSSLPPGDVELVALDDYRLE